MTLTPTPTPATPPRASGEVLDPSAKERWTVTVEVRSDGPPGIIRLRRLLKSMWRAYGLKLIDLRDVKAADEKTRRSEE